VVSTADGEISAEGLAEEFVVWAHNEAVENAMINRAIFFIDELRQSFEPDLNKDSL
jgi:hypothetical protein